LDIRSDLRETPSSIYIRLHSQFANRLATGLTTLALVVFGVGFAGCGANSYAGMSRAASGQIELEDATGAGGGYEGHSRAAVRDVRAGQVASGMNRRSDATTTVIGAESTEAAIHPMTPMTGEAAMAVKSVSPFKMRKVLALQSLSCGNQSMTGAGTTTCTLRLSSVAPGGGLVVAVSSNNAAVSVPGAVTVAAGTSRVTFEATVAAVNTTQTASITANANGSTASFGIQLNAGTPSLTLSSTTVPFGSVAVGQTATRVVSLTSSGSAPLTISSISVAGSLFKATGVTVPLTLNPGQSAALTLQFYSDHTSSFTGTVTIFSNSTQGIATIAMSADGGPSISGLTCNTQSYAGAGTDSCLVSLYGTAPDTGFAISLSSNNSSVTVPASVIVPFGSMSASFSASVKSVSTNQSAMLTATAGGIAKTFTVQLGPASAMLTANASSIPFGTVLINSPAEQSITLTSSGTSPVTINSVAITGAGFASSGLTVPMTLNPGQTAVFNVQFTPTASGNFSGQIAIGSNSSSGIISIGLNGSGYGHKVQLNWNAASSSAVVGYNVYRVASGSTSYQRVNSSAVSSTTFTDGSVQCGSSYTYYVTSLNGAGLESVPSNTTAVGIPTS
jgi:hypothetical protein